MKAMVLEKLGCFDERKPALRLADLPIPVPGNREVLISVSACGVCHTELDEIEGRTEPPQLPIVLGHQVVGVVKDSGSEVNRFPLGERVGVAWIHSTCGTCSHCSTGNENLCSEFRATGRDANGGYAEYMVVREDFAYPIPAVFSDVEAAPLLCAGAIGYRALNLADLRDGQNLGLTGFGASGHLVLKMVQHCFPASDVCVFARSEMERAFARELGAVWAGDTDEKSPHQLDGIIDTTPVWKTVVKALENLKPGGRLVINAIRKEDGDKEYLLNLDYRKHLWMEKEIKSVANVTRRDVVEFLELASQIPLKPDTQEFPLEDSRAQG